MSELESVREGLPESSSESVREGVDEDAQQHCTDMQPRATEGTGADNHASSQEPQSTPRVRKLTERGQELHDEQEKEKVKHESSPLQHHSPPQAATHPKQEDSTAALVRAFAESISASRLPVPEPATFNGDPLRFNDWKISFQTLIDRKNIPVEEKIYYLRKYIGGPAKKAIESYFLLGTGSAYHAAWAILEERYGNPFLIAKAFRDKLDAWPKISSKGSVELQELADFLRSCEAAMSQIRGLEVLNDCNENQKILVKLPDWLTSRWNRKVVEVEEQSHTFPSFSQFVKFLTREAKIACNPITSLHALKPSESEKIKVSTSRGPGAKVLATNSDENAVSTSCVFCEKAVTYSREFIPANRDHIPTPETAKAWPHLEHLANEIAPQQSCDVGLLIGYNCPQALVPRQVVSGGENQPFAQRTDLGWSIVGYGNPCLDYGDAIGVSHQVIVKQVMPGLQSSSNLTSEVHYVCRTQIKEVVLPADVIKVLESDFVERASEDSHMSQEDLLFLSKMEKGIRLKDDGHYEMPLPFKKGRPNLPDNKILQQMCRDKLSWDDALPDDLRPLWEFWLQDLQNLAGVKIKRCYIPSSFEVQRYELHHFSDASVSGYGECSYLRAVSASNEVHCSLVMGKSRVAPTKVTTIPRLELSAAVVAVRTSDMLKKELEVDCLREFFWTDSKVVLGYINNEARRFHVYVANRVERIKQSTESAQWMYVASGENPADHASRGLTAEQLVASNWFTGPDLLWQKELPSGVVKVGEIASSDPELKKAQVHDTQAKEVRSLLDHLHKFSDWSRMVKAIARLKRWARETKGLKPRLRAGHRGSLTYRLMLDR
ncbi:hypothetical protein AAFF_G00418650 [Aldrovandia affinis]|uniref:Uncharacterized protein n=1 Tax=Aldrovandia affinis TaxID=143900 RepID=A0AAD7R3B1_9TELE|nr:hypothetical protein AAFF_G00418650 [Aldrovandia affinis]